MLMLMTTVTTVARVMNLYGLDIVPKGKKKEKRNKRGEYTSFFSNWLMSLITLHIPFIDAVAKTEAHKQIMCEHYLLT